MGVSSDEAATAVADNCLKLRELSLAGCHLITDESVDRLGDTCHKFNRVDLTGCPRVTKAKTLIRNNRGLMYLIPGFLREVPQNEEKDPALPLSKQNDARQADRGALWHDL